MCMSCLDVIASDDSELVLSSEVVVISNERHQHSLLSKAVKVCMSCLDVIASDDSELVLSSEVVVISNERHQHYLLSKAVKMCHVMSCHVMM